MRWTLSGIERTPPPTTFRPLVGQAIALAVGTAPGENARACRKNRLSAPERIRTSDLRFRRPTLCAARRSTCPWRRGHGGGTQTLLVSARQQPFDPDQAVLHGVQAGGEDC